MKFKFKAWCKPQIHWFFVLIGTFVTSTLRLETFRVVHLANKFKIKNIATVKVRSFAVLFYDYYALTA